VAEITLKVYQCDKPIRGGVCGKEGKRYSILFEDGTKILDRCAEHAGPIEKLREEPGEFVAAGAGKGTFKKSSPEDIRAAVARHGQK